MGQEYIRNITVLGSVPSLGPVILFDDMEALLKWTKSGTGGDSVLEKSATVAYNGSASLHLITRTTGATAGDTENAMRWFFARPGKRYSVELIWIPDTALDASSVTFRCYIYDGALLHQVGFKFDTANDKWQYYSSAGTWVDVPGGGQGLLIDHWHRLCFEFDQSSGEYIKLVSDSMEVDLDGVGYYKAASPAANAFQIVLSVVAGASAPGEIYVDDVLVMEI